MPGGLRPATAAGTLGPARSPTSRAPALREERPDLLEIAHAHPGKRSAQLAPDTTAVCLDQQRVAVRPRPAPAAVFAAATEATRTRSQVQQISTSKVWKSNGGRDGRRRQVRAAAGCVQLPRTNQHLDIPGDGFDVSRLDPAARSQHREESVREHDIPSVSPQPAEQFRVIDSASSSRALSLKCKAIRKATLSPGKLRITIAGGGIPLVDAVIRVEPEDQSPAARPFIASGAKSSRWGCRTPWRQAAVSGGSVTVSITTISSTSRRAAETGRQMGLVLDDHTARSRRR